MSDPAPPRSDFVYSTCILSPTRLLASFYWARYKFFGPSGAQLVLCDFSVTPLTADSWSEVGERLRQCCTERRSRLPIPLGIFVENEIVVRQAREQAHMDVKAIPEHIVAPDNWQAMCQSCAGFMASSALGYTALAQANMKDRPFLSEAAVMAGPRADDTSTANNLLPGATATIAGFIYGVVLGLDPIAAKDPKAKPPTPSRRN